MPKASKQTASNVDDMGVSRRARRSSAATRSSSRRSARTPTRRLSSVGFPTTRCQSPHWGYVLAGRLTFRYADHEETYEAGDAYYGPPGHLPAGHRGTEIVEFSPTEEYARTLEVVAGNFAALADG